MEKLKEQNLVSQIEKKDAVPVLILGKSTSYKRVRIYIFPDNSSLVIGQTPANIDSGKVGHRFEFDARFRGINATERLCAFSFGNKLSSIGSQNSKIKFENYSTKNSPIADKEFLDKSVIAINKTIKYSLVESQAAKAESN